MVWKKLATGLLILVMGSLMLNQALYTHNHVLPDGSIVSHAHPFNKSQESKQDASHQHSTLEFFLIQNLLLLFLVALAAPSLNSLSSKYIKVQPVTSSYIPVFLIALPGRAPPACM